ncbi:lipopolysaccharide transport periplasmic protein LptA [Shewanella sp. NIFS-20-20]|uniref:lipopolysaccharide transport periplasmic protein LptA n=1 Tax=Shewanella sp. NIFS-20-20 TaxID=2853806 RepID=UPI001C48835B|nr:lipopolysaccharide transport periplasmic protein LptA [Shewanella sp. NIFS-20-20]MBV7316155.1 lipopolysaccharide transport periplasmic protein LptA [Shewanella sp. NIFS-20-20]
MNLNKSIITLMLCGLSMGAIANTDSLTQEVKIDAARQFADIKNKRVIYYGPVVVTQGTIKIDAQELSASSNIEDGATILVAHGSPATYSQLLENNLRATASADEIQYNISKRIMTLIGNASIEQDGSKVSAEKIIYNIEKQQLVAEGDKQKDDRVITIIKPESFQDQVPAKDVGKLKQEIKSTTSNKPPVSEEQPR